MKKEKITLEEALLIKEALNDRAVWMQEIGDPKSMKHDADEKLKVLQAVFEPRETNYHHFAYLIEPNVPGNPDFFNRQYRRFDFRDIGILINDRGVDMPILRRGRTPTKDDTIEKQAHLIRDLQEKDLHKDSPEMYRLYQRCGI